MAEGEAGKKPPKGEEGKSLFNLAVFGCLRLKSRPGRA